jgi:hypothetical protein
VDAEAIADRHGVKIDHQFKNVEEATVRKQLQHLADSLSNGRRLRLLCWCHPKRCHASAIAKVVTQLTNGISFDERSAPPQIRDTKTVEQAQRALGFMRHGGHPDEHPRCGIYGLADLNGGMYTRQWVTLAYGRWLDGCQAKETLQDVVWAVTEEWMLARNGEVTSDWWQLVADSANRALRHVPPTEVEDRNNVEYAAWYLQRWHNTGFTPTSFALLKEFYKEWGERIPQPVGAAPPLSIVVEVYMPMSASPALCEVWEGQQPRLRTNNVPKLVLRGAHWYSERGRPVSAQQTPWRERMEAEQMIGGVCIPPQVLKR